MTNDLIERMAEAIHAADPEYQVWSPPIVQKQAKAALKVVADEVLRDTWSAVKDAEMNAESVISSVAEMRGNHGFSVRDEELYLKCYKGLSDKLNAILQEVDGES